MASGEEETEGSKSEETEVQRSCRTRTDSWLILFAPGSRLVFSNAGNASRTAKLFALSITMGVNGCFDTNAFTELLRTLATSTHA